MKKIPEKSKDFISKLDGFISSIDKILTNQLAEGLIESLQEHRNSLEVVREDLIDKAAFVSFDDLIGKTDVSEIKEIFKRNKNTDRIIKGSTISGLTKKLQLLEQLEFLGFKPIEFQVFSKQSKEIAEYIVTHYEVLSIFLSSLRFNSNKVIIHTNKTRLNKNGKLRNELLKRLKRFANKQEPSQGLIDYQSIEDKTDKTNFWKDKWNFVINDVAIVPFLSGHWLSCFVNSTLINQLKASITEDKFETITLFQLKGAPEYGIGTIEFDVLALVNGATKRIICIECKSGNLSRVVETELEKSVKRRDTLLKIVRDLKLSAELLDFYFVVPPPFTNNQKKDFSTASKVFKENDIEFLNFERLRPLLNEKYLSV